MILTQKNAGGHILNYDLQLYYAGGHIFDL